MTSSPQDFALFTESSVQGGPAPISAWRVFASDWVAHARASSGRSFASSSAFSPGGSSWRTSPVSCRASAPAPAEGSAPPPPAPVALTLFEEEPADDPGGEADSSPVPDDAWHSTAGGWVPSSGAWGNAGMASPTECWTLSTSEFPSDAVVSSLSDVLETAPDLSKYCLSPKAAAGILRRMARRARRRRERVLPAALNGALQDLARRHEE